MKRTFITILTFAMFFANATLLLADGTQPSGVGTEASPYQVSTLDNLLWISTNSSSWAAGTYFEQTQNIDASATSTWNDNGAGGYFGFSPIGNDGSRFSGYYDGQGYTIDGLFINRPATDDIGLFGVAQDPNWLFKPFAKDLGLTNMNITGKECVGGLIGQMTNGSTASGCYTTGSVSGENRVGGFVGLTKNGAIPKGLSYSSATVSGTGSVGGFVGRVEGNSGTIVHCYSNGFVNCASAGPVGGFVGKCYGSVSECYSNTVVTISGGGPIGGFAGKNSATISNCYTFSDVSRDGGGHWTFGFCGENSGTIDTCYAAGTNDNGSGARGFIGTNTGTATDNYYNSDTYSADNPSVGAIAKTTAEMKMEATYSNWDFSAIWESNNNYPNLVNNSNPDLGSIEVTKEIVGQWDFNDATDFSKATVGDDLLLFGNPTTVTGPKDGDGAILVDNGDYFKAVTNITNAGEGSNINTYSLSMDIKLDVLNGYACLLQTDLSNGRDGSLFLTSGKTIGNGDIGYSNPVITEGEWYRMILVAEEHKTDSVTIDIYLNGSLAYAGSPTSVDGRLSLQDSLFLFLDNDGEEKPTNVSQVVLYNYTLSSVEVAELGSPSGEPQILLSPYFTIPPHAIGTTILSMTATDTVGNIAEYLFECITDGGNSSSWQVSDTYIDSNLTMDMKYSYTVKGRDASGNETEYTDTISARTDYIGELVYAEANGKCVMEAEKANIKANGDFSIAGWGGIPYAQQMRWEADTTAEGYAGIGYMTTINGIAANADWDNGTELSWEVEISTPGEYFIAVRRNSNGDGANDSARPGVDGVKKSESTFWGEVTEFTWARCAESLGTLIAGKHKIQIRRREDGFMIDRVMIATVLDSLPAEGSTEVGPDETLKPTSIETNNNDCVVTEFALGQNYPNPFNPSTTIGYALPKTSHVTITVYNMLGQKVAEILNKKMNVGRHNVKFDASFLSSGIYFYSIQADEFNSTKKMILLK